MAPSLNLPPPTKVQDDTLLNPKPPKQATVEHVDELTAESSSAAATSTTKPKFSSGGIIYPPPDIRTIVDTTAGFVARVGSNFEQKIRNTEKGNQKFSFLNQDDPYHAYYQHRIEVSKRGDAEPTSNDTAKQQQQEQQDGDHEESEERDGQPKEPPPFQFSADLPNITAVDLDVLKLTALFTARKGRGFAAALQAKESRSYQFEFLKPNHSLFGYFNRLVEQYQLVIQPPTELLERVKIGAYGSAPVDGTAKAIVTGPGCGGARPILLEEAKKRAEWEKWVREKRKKADEEEEKQKAAFNEIDWQDFVVVATVELTDADEHIDLPPPLSLREVENMTMAQKRMAAIIMETSEGDEEQEQGQEKEGLASEPKGTNGQGAERKGDEKQEEEGGDEEDAEMEMDESDEEEEQVRKDYVPRGLAAKAAAKGVQTTQCPVCGEEVAVDEMGEHVRIELLNPAFREQRRELEARKAQQAALQAGADPSQILRKFAGARTDIFGAAADEEARARREAEEKRLAKEKEKIIWDGHANSRNTAVDYLQKNVGLEEQINQLHRKPRTAPLPNIGPQMPVPTSSRPQEPVVGGASLADPSKTIAAGLPPRPNIPPHMQGAAVIPSKRPAEGEHSDQPPSQRSATLPPQPPLDDSTLSAAKPSTPTLINNHQHLLPKKPDGTLHPEEEWLKSKHPASNLNIKIKIKLPEATHLTEKANGETIEFETVLTSTIGAVRDYVYSVVLESKVGASKLKLKVGGKATTLRQSLAYWNLEDGDEISVSIAK
ncbi:hypothetical protein IE53DRAFT_347341 [Violaceomyces palustris]|uniref:Uncharacterized protein n=1 Tax=Violaceomyces palustris TaxID=1673888 RepID=A0ACD0NRQ8_9BASI|nr:hypothetical protein IE53DRAFT_347341 [Violaceomyces palustris]